MSHNLLLPLVIQTRWKGGMVVGGGWMVGWQGDEGATGCNGGGGRWADGGPSLKVVVCEGGGFDGAFGVGDGGGGCRGSGAPVRRGAHKKRRFICQYLKLTNIVSIRQFGMFTDEYRAHPV
jgi:hypothetical protein